MTGYCTECGTTTAGTDEEHLREFHLFGPTSGWNRRDGTAELVEALRLAVQRLNESGTGEMGLIDTIHETDSILRSALAKHGGGT